MIDFGIDIVLDHPSHKLESTTWRLYNRQTLSCTLQCFMCDVQRKCFHIMLLHVMSFLKQMEVCFWSPWLTKFELFELSWSTLLFWSQALLCAYWWEDLWFSSPPDTVTDRSLYKLLLVTCSKLMELCLCDGLDFSIIVSDDVFTRAPMQPLLCSKFYKMSWISSHIKELRSIFSTK